MAFSISASYDSPWYSAQCILFSSSLLFSLSPTLLLSFSFSFSIPITNYVESLCSLKQKTLIFLLKRILQECHQEKKRHNNKNPGQLIQWTELEDPRFKLNRMLKQEKSTIFTKQKHGTVLWTLQTQNSTRLHQSKLPTYRCEQCVPIVNASIEGFLQQGQI